MHRNKEGKRMNEEFEEVKEHNLLHLTGKFLKINNVSCKYFKPRVSWCKVEEGVTSCKLWILTTWMNYVSNLSNGISNANFVTDRTVSVEIRNGVNSWYDNCTNSVWWREGSDNGHENNKIQIFCRQRVLNMMGMRYKCLKLY